MVNLLPGWRISWSSRPEKEDMNPSVLVEVVGWLIAVLEIRDGNGVHRAVAGPLHPKGALSKFVSNLGSSISPLHRGPPIEGVFSRCFDEFEGHAGNWFPRIGM